MSANKTRKNTDTASLSNYRLSSRVHLPQKKVKYKGLLHSVILCSCKEVNPTHCVQSVAGVNFSRSYRDCAAVLLRDSKHWREVTKCSAPVLKWFVTVGQAT